MVIHTILLWTKDQKKTHMLLKWSSRHRHDVATARSLQAEPRSPAERMRVRLRRGVFGEPVVHFSSCRHAYLGRPNLCLRGHRQQLRLGPQTLVPSKIDRCSVRSGHWCDTCSCPLRPITPKKKSGMPAAIQSTAFFGIPAEYTT